MQGIRKLHFFLVPIRIDGEPGQQAYSVRLNSGPGRQTLRDRSGISGNILAAFGHLPRKKAEQLRW